MTDPLAPQDDGGTELSAEEKEGLIPSYITLRRELNEAEQANNLAGQEWGFSRQRNVLDETFLKNLHKRMYGNVWNWAGHYRATGKNIGVDAYRIPTELRLLLEDCRYWIQNSTYGCDEIAARFHHRLVSIHCYPNGNGRHARLAADLLLKTMGQERFSWGQKSLADDGETRKRYITALQKADRHDIRPLLDFVRS
jgi:Fic-DOC domain mobile mystery protein B